MSGCSHCRLNDMTYVARLKKAELFKRARKRFDESKLGKSFEVSCSSRFKNVFAIWWWFLLVQKMDSVFYYLSESVWHAEKS